MEEVQTVSENISSSLGMPCIQKVANGTLSSNLSLNRLTEALFLCKHSDQGTMEVLIVVSLLTSAAHVSSILTGAGCWLTMPVVRLAMQAGIVLMPMSQDRPQKQLHDNVGEEHVQYHGSVEPGQMLVALNPAVSFTALRLLCIATSLACTITQCIIVNC